VHVPLQLPSVICHHWLGIRTEPACKNYSPEISISNIFTDGSAVVVL